MFRYSFTTCSCGYCQPRFLEPQGVDYTELFRALPGAPQYGKPGGFWQEAPRRVQTPVRIFSCRPQRAQSRKCLKSTQRQKRRRFVQKLKS